MSQSPNKPPFLPPFLKSQTTKRTTTKGKTFKPIIPSSSSETSDKKDDTLESLIRASNIQERQIRTKKDLPKKKQEKEEKGEKGESKTVISFDPSRTTASSKKLLREKEREQFEQENFGGEYYKHEVINPSILTDPLIVPFPDITKMEKMNTQRSNQLVFLQDSDFLEENQCALFQFPTDLPFQNNSEFEPEKMKKKETAGGFLNFNSILNPHKTFQNKFNNLPSGQIGKIKRYKSGKIEFETNDGFIFLVSDNGGTSFLQNFMALNQESCTYLGEISKRIVVQPDFQSLLKKQ